MSVETHAWWYAAVRVLMTAALGMLVGWLLGNVWAGLAGLLALYLGWHLATLYRLDRWLRHRSIADPPDASGIWGEVIAQVVRLHRRKRYHKQQFVQLLRQIDRSTAALPDGVVILDAGREIVWFNRTAARLLHLRRADIGLRVDNLLRQPAFARYLELGRFESPVIIQPDARFLSIQAVPHGAGQLLLLVRDVSRQMRLEEVRKDFVANASHELRSPLTVIAGYLETLSQDPALDPELQGPIAEMRRQAERMTTLIRDLLELSRIEASGEQVEGEPIDVAAMLARLRKEVLESPRRPREIRVHIDSGVRLIGAESEIHSAFANLVDNAAKYTPADGSIDLRWWADEEGCHFSVADTGIGIPAEHIPRLTERFYRVDPGRSRETGGSGLGLSIVNHVLQRHGATLEIESTPGRGSRFTCHFPPERIAAGREENTVDV